MLGGGLVRSAGMVGYANVRYYRPSERQAPKIHWR